jgi:hypothetical protein
VTLVLVLAVAGATWGLRGAGSLVPAMPDQITVRIGGLAPALMAAFVVTQLTGRNGLPSIDARMGAVLVAAILAWRRAPFAICVVAGAATAAVLRLVAG